VLESEMLESEGEGSIAVCKYDVLCEDLCVVILTIVFSISGVFGVCTVSCTVLGVCTVSCTVLGCTTRLQFRDIELCSLLMVNLSLNYISH